MEPKATVIEVTLLRSTRGFRASVFGRLNNGHQRQYGHKLQKWPRIQMVLKQFTVGYIQRSAKVFTKGQILQGLQLNKTDPEWTL